MLRADGRERMTPRLPPRSDGYIDPVPRQTWRWPARPDPLIDPVYASLCAVAELRHGATLRQRDDGPCEPLGAG